jgi:hypothetical protein
MNALPQQDRYPRPPRVRPAEFTPVVLRIADGSCTPGELEIFSVTGGLLALPKLLNHGSRVKLMFLTQTGPVLSAAEMLRPVSWTEQAFRFVELGDADQRRLRDATHTLAKPIAPTTSLHEQKPEKPEPKQDKLISPPPATAVSIDREQQWIEKYRAAVDNRRPPRTNFPRILFGAFTAATLGLGIIYALQLHLLR